MNFDSILWNKRQDALGTKELLEPDFFVDLNLDQVIANIMGERINYDLHQYFYEVPKDSETIDYRLEVLRDMEDPIIFKGIAEFSVAIRRSKEYSDYSTRAKNDLLTKRWHMDSAQSFCKAVHILNDCLSLAEPKSKGFLNLLEWLTQLINEDGFRNLDESVDKLKREFDQVQFSMQIERDRIIINPEPLEVDYCRNIQDIFNKEEQIENYSFDNPIKEFLDLSLLEERIVKYLKKPYAKVFRELDKFYHDQKRISNDKLDQFEREVQFYIAFLSYRSRFLDYGFPFCYPKVGGMEKFSIVQGYDLALASKNMDKKQPVVFNDAYYEGNERFFVVTGPNQGGKTTFARAMGQILYFSYMGLTPPCKEASLPMFSGILTHFSEEESLMSGQGKLKEELIRLKPMMKENVNHKFVIINELFTTATTYDAYIMGKKVMDHFSKEQCHGIYVTHIQELAKEEESVVSLVASVDTLNTNVRTYQIQRKEADGRGYANSIANRLHLTYDEIKERIGI